MRFYEFKLNFIFLLKLLLVVLFLVLLYHSKNMKNVESTESKEFETAVFSTGCFWCFESVVQETKGVLDATSGYAGGTEVNPTYEDVYEGLTGHREAVKVTFDPKQISYADLLMLFWQNIDPTDEGGQFFDRGFSYTTAIFYNSEEQKNTAEKSLEEIVNLNKFEKPIATKILPFTTFYKAEEYHQDFYKKSPIRYSTYSNSSGRKEFKKKIWDEIKETQNKM